jgi:aryl carrier-like protein
VTQGSGEEPTAGPTNDDNSGEVVLARIWERILGVRNVGPDDDFFSLGGDSLIAIEVIGAAQEQGLRLTLVDLFRNPTPRGACGSAAAVGERAPMEGPLLSADDQALVPPTAEAVYPATSLQLGLIYENLLSGGDLYTDVVSRTVNLPLRAEALREALHDVVRRHPVLRTRFDLTTFSEAMQVVEPRATPALDIEDVRDLDGALAAEHYERAVRDLLRPFDIETPPLLRTHAAILGATSFRLTYSFHHAILDGWSESLLADEVIRRYAALLDGRRPDFPAPAPFEEYVRLERAARRNAEARRHFEAVDATGAAGLPRRPDADRQADRSLRKVEAVVPEPDVRALERHSADWGVPMKSLLLAAHCSVVASMTDGSSALVGLMVSGRPESTGGDLTLGLFLNTLPVRLRLTSLSWRDAARLALQEENVLLPYRHYPAADVYGQTGGHAFDTVFNYVHFRVRDTLVASGLVGRDQDLRDRSSFPVRVEAVNDAEGPGLVLEVTVDEALHPDGLAEELLKRMTDAVHRLATTPQQNARAALEPISEE